MERFFLTPGVIMTFIMIVWLIKHPKQIWEAFLFSNREEKGDVWVSIVVWIFYIGSLLTVNYLVQTFLIP